MQAPTLKIDKKVVVKDHKQYLIPTQLELDELSPQAQELAHEAYLSLKPVLDAKLIKKALQMNKNDKKSNQLDQTIQNKIIQQMAVVMALSKLPAPKFTTTEVKKIDMTEVNSPIIKPGVPISPVLMTALIRYNNGRLAQQAEQLNHLNINHHTPTPTPFNTKPDMKPK